MEKIFKTLASKLHKRNEGNHIRNGDKNLVAINFRTWRILRTFYMAEKMRATASAFNMGLRTSAG